MKTVFFYIIFNQAFLGTWFEKPPVKATVSGEVIVRPCTAPNPIKPQNIAVGEVVFVTGEGWCKIISINPNSKRCKNY